MSHSDCAERDGTYIVLRVDAVINYVDSSTNQKSQQYYEHLRTAREGKVALGQVFSEYFSFPCQFSFHQLHHNHHHHPGMVQ
jgi:hypothetical protein